MEVIERFENKLGFTEIYNYSDCYATVIRSDFAEISHFNTYKFKQDAIKDFQFHKQWLIRNECHCLL